MTSWYSLNMAAAVFTAQTVFLLKFRKK